ncbi:MAG: hypothetical protein NTX05_05965 [Fusobacteria bacterium]|nr:hypothetical protein [Fusobacteriota bacterium]
MIKKVVALVVLIAGISTISLSYNWNTQANIGISKVLAVSFFNASSQHTYASSSVPLILSLQEYYQFHNAPFWNNIWLGGGIEYNSIQNYNNNGEQAMFSNVPIFLAMRINANVSGSSLNPYIEGRLGLNAPLGNQLPQPVGMGGYAGFGIGISQATQYQSGLNAEILFELSQIIMQNQSLFTTKIGFAVGYNFNMS